MRSVMRVMLTERCNADCRNCFNKYTRKNIDMDVLGFKRMCVYLAKSCHITKLKIMGGEPTVHPHFLEMYEFAQEVFPVVVVFTNAINNEITKIHPRKDDIVVYNFDCLNDVIESNKMLLDESGQRLFEVQISSDSDVERMLCKLDSIVDVFKDRKFVVSQTLNCTENIFEHKRKISQKWAIIENYFLQRNIERIWDHGIPECFLVESNIKFRERSLCSVNCCGLISSNFELLYCNQYPVNLGCFYDQKNDVFMNFGDVVRALSEAFAKKMAVSREKICGKCPLWFKNCNGGCFMHKEFISRKSVIESI